MLTEEQARTKWCPFARTIAQHHTGYGTVNRYMTSEGRGGGPFQDCLCIASDCMWWRWSSSDLIYLETGEPVLEGQVYKTDEVELRGALGYCGIAGAPRKMER